MIDHDYDPLAIECPACTVVADADDYRSQAIHMEVEHPDIVAKRRAESLRFDGWEDDG
jgi:hypothetical protein